jgi:hypothetical protein
MKSDVLLLLICYVLPLVMKSDVLLLLPQAVVNTTSGGG